MLYEEFAAGLDSRIDPVYQLKGEDDYWLCEAYRKVKTLCHEVDLAVFESPSSVADALAALECIPFLSERRVVVLSGYASFDEADKKRLSAYAKAPVEGAVLVLYRCAWAPKEATVCDFSKPKPQEVESWLRSYCQAKGVAIQSGAIRLLVSYCDGDANRLVGEVQKLAAYQDGAPIDEGAVAATVTPSENYQVYTFSDKVSKGDYIGARRVLDSLLSTAVDYPTFLGLLINHYRMAYYRKISRLSDEELGRALGGKKAFAVKKAGDTARYYTPTALYRLLQHLYQSEFAFKSGRLTPEQALDSAMIQAIERRNH